MSTKTTPCDFGDCPYPSDTAFPCEKYCSEWHNNVLAQFEPEPEETRTITVTYHKEDTFKLPEKCGKCPLHKSGRDCNATIEYCTLKYKLDPKSYYGVDIDKSPFKNNCPAIDGAVYEM